MKHVVADVQIRRQNVQRMMAPSVGVLAAAQTPDCRCRPHSSPHDGVRGSFRRRAILASDAYAMASGRHFFLRPMQGDVGGTAAWLSSPLGL